MVEWRQGEGRDVSSPQEGDWQRLQSVFRAAAELSEERRESLLARECGDDERLRARVEELLKAHDESAAALEPPIELSPAARVGQRIGRYRMIRLIAEGGMGVVYEAEQDEPRRRVALKVLRPGLLSPRALRRFQLEAELLGRLRHPGIAQIYEAGTFVMRESDLPEDRSRQPFFAMELVEGVPLGKFIERERPPLAQRLMLLARIADAVHHAHTRGVLHRDLKAGNVLVADERLSAIGFPPSARATNGVTSCPEPKADGRQPCPKILDFGVARAIGADVEALTCFTSAGDLVGTLSSMSPEQLAGEPDDLDVRCDVYALGVLAYELLCGQRPFAFDTVTLAEAVRRICVEEPPRLGTIDARLGGDVELIIARAMEKEKTARYDSAAELADDISRHLRHEPVRARPPSRTYLLRKFVRRHRAPVIGAASVALALVLGLAGFAWKAAAEREQRTIAESALAQANTINRLLESVLMSPDPFLGAATDVTVRQAVDRLALRLGSELRDQPQVEAAVRFTIGNSYRHMRLIEEAAPHLERSLQLHESLYGDADQRTGSATAMLAALRENQLRFDEAEDLYRRALAIFARDAQADPIVRLRIQRDLGRVLRKRGELDVAERIVVQTLRECRRRVGNNDLETAYGALVLATIRSAQGAHAEALELVREAREVRRAALGAEHPSTLVAASMHAKILAAGGRTAEAEPMARRAFEALRTAVGPHHQSTRIARRALAGILRDLGRQQEATALDGKSPGASAAREDD